MSVTKDQMFHRRLTDTKPTAGLSPEKQPGARNHPESTGSCLRFVEEMMVLLKHHDLLLTHNPAGLQSALKTQDQNQNRNLQCLLVLLPSTPAPTRSHPDVQTFSFFISERSHCHRASKTSPLQQCSVAPVYTTNSSSSPQ